MSNVTPFGGEIKRVKCSGTDCDNMVAYSEIVGKEKHYCSVPCLKSVPGTSVLKQRAIHNRRKQDSKRLSWEKLLSP